MSTGFPDEPGSREPGLDHLIRALTADGYPHELTGRDAALAAFRAARTRPRRTRFAVPRGMSTRLSAAAAALIAAFAGLTAAAYAKALPGPVQHIAYSMLSPFGVPDSQSAPGSHTLPPHRKASGSAAAQHHGSASPSARASCPCPAPPSRPAVKGSALAVSAAREQLPANGYDQFTGKLTYHGRPESGVRIRLQEQVAGAAGWRLVGSGVTGGHGGVSLGVQHVTKNATFRLAGPDGVRSPSIVVTVIPRVLLWRAPALPGTDKLVAAARFGDPGDVVTLEELSGGSWQNVRVKALGADHRVSFVLLAGPSAGRDFRVTLQANRTHGAGVSATLSEPRTRAVIAARAIEPHPALPHPSAPGHGVPHHPVYGPVLPGPVTPAPVTPGPLTDGQAAVER